MKLMINAIIAVIRAYQRHGSPVLVHLLGHSCRFQPTCSEYARQAFASHGLIKGAILSGKRILRCHPFSPPQLDPVPR